MLCLKKETAEVYYLGCLQKLLKRQDSEQLQSLLMQSSRNRARFCLHSRKESDLHEMFEMLSKDVYMRPHKQINKCTSYHIVSGMLKLYLFDDGGKIIDIFSLGDFHSGKPYYFRAPKNTYRTLVPESDFVLYHETTTGPFNKADTVFAPWSPIEDDVDGRKLFKSFVTNALNF